MKKLVILIAVCSLGLMSCKKDYTCNCKKIRTDEDGNTTTTSDGSYTFKDNAARAEKRCDEQERSDSDILGDYTRECQVD